MDFPGKRLYWVDAKYKVVETIKLDGTGRTVVKQLPERAHPWSIDVFEEMMMWSDTDRFHIYFNNRFTGDVIKNISISQPSLNGIKIAQAALQTSGTLSASYLPAWCCEDTFHMQECNLCHLHSLKFVPTDGSASYLLLAHMISNNSVESKFEENQTVH